MNKTLIVLCFILLGVAVAGSAQNKKKNQDPSSGGIISARDTKFIDSYGRQVILSGVNFVNKDPKTNYLSQVPPSLFEQFHKWGFNCIRLGIIWDGVEPEPGKYNEQYLDEIEKRVDSAAKHHIYVMLDMHQDLYGRKYGDGAPVWATLDENLPHQEGVVWSDSYELSASVQKSFDNFWANKPASDGIGVQDHYVKMWQHIAKRFSKSPNVIGYDVMNEPFNGSDALSIMPLMLKEYAALLAEETGKEPPTEQELLEIWANESSRLEALKRLAKAEKYARVIDAAYETNKKFESEKLQPMYQKAANAIREVDATHILFWEHGYFGNTGISSAIVPVKGKNGQPDPLQAYAAHGYDLSVDTKSADAPNNERVELIFNRINETSKRMNIPVLIGEWGAFSGDDNGNTTVSARNIISIIERSHFGNTYWCYGDGIVKSNYFNEALVRPYPQFIGGVLESYSYDHETGTFKCSWKESSQIKAPTVIFIPDLNSLIKESMKCSLRGKKPVIQSIKNSKSGYIIIPVSGNTVKKALVFKLKVN